MAWLEDVASLLTTAGVAVLNQSLFLSTAAGIPGGVGPYILIIEQGGMGLERLHTDNVGRLDAAAYEMPGAQITVRAVNYVNARTMAKAAFNAVDGIYNRTINGVWYREIVALQRPFDIGPDDAERVRLVFNILGVKALS